MLLYLYQEMYYFSLREQGEKLKLRTIPDKYSNCQEFFLPYPPLPLDFTDYSNHIHWLALEMKQGNKETHYGMNMDHIHLQFCLI